MRRSISGGTWLFLSSLTVAVIGFVFWLIITRIVGAKSIGVASSIISSSTIAITVISAGLNIAVIREIAAKGTTALKASIVVSSLLAFLAGVISIPLVRILGYGNFSLIAFVLALTSLISIPLLSALIGLEMFKDYFIVISGASLAKIVVGVLLALLGFKMLAPLLGYAMYPIIAGGIALLILLKITSGLSVSNGKLYSEIKDLVKLSLSNYPYVFSGQILSMLSVYFFAFFTRSAVNTGTFYISLMITLSIAAIPVSILNAALPIGTRRNADPFGEGFRLGLGLATPLIVLAIAVPDYILKLINTELIGGAETLRVLLLSIGPLSALGAIINKLNKEKRVKELSTIGVLRLAVLMFLLPLLIKYESMLGAALSFLLANFITLIWAFRYESLLFKNFIGLWSTQIIAYLISVFLASEILSSIISLFISLILLETIGLFTFNDLTFTLKVALNALFGKE